MSKKRFFFAPFPKFSFVEEEDLVADTLRFREVVGHDNHAVSFFEILKELCYVQGGKAVSGRTGLIQKENFRLNAKGAGDTKPLGLPSGKA